MNRLSALFDKKNSKKLTKREIMMLGSTVAVCLVTLAVILAATAILL